MFGSSIFDIKFLNNSNKSDYSVMLVNEMTTNIRKCEVVTWYCNYSPFLFVQSVQ